MKSALLPSLRKLLHMLIIFALGALIGTLAESQFNVFGVALYPECKTGLKDAGPGLSEFLCWGGWCPSWAPFLFGFGGVAIALGAHINDWVLWPRLRWQTLKPVRPKEALLGLVIFAVAWLVVSRPELGSTWVRSAWLAVCAVAAWVAVGQASRVSAWEAVQTGLLGTCFEIILGRGGLYTYQAGFDGLAGVPEWLPLLYAIAGISVGAAVRLAPPAPRGY
jgi:hypothetical protein